MAKRKRKSSGRMAGKGLPNPIDVHVGSRVRLRRTLLGISQTTLAEAVGLTFQQVQKYEKGANRVSSSRLVDLANALDVAIPYFFEEMSAAVGAQTPSALLKAGQRPAAVGNDTDPMAKRETLEFVRAYYSGCGRAEAASRADQNDCQVIGIATMKIPPARPSRVKG